MAKELSEMTLDELKVVFYDQQAENIEVARVFNEQTAAEVRVVDAELSAKLQVIRDVIIQREAELAGEANLVHLPNRAERRAKKKDN